MPLIETKNPYRIGSAVIRGVVESRIDVPTRARIAIVDRMRPVYAVSLESMRHAFVHLTARPLYQELRVFGLNFAGEYPRGWEQIRA
jgi:hypothetical protein